MRTWTIFGHSDDLVQFAENGKTFEEVGAYGGAVIGFDDGTVVRADYGDKTGLWRFEPLHVGEGSKLERVYTPPETNEDDYSEKWELTGNINRFFDLRDWKEGDIVPSAAGIAEALSTAREVKLTRTRNDDLELLTDRRRLVIDAGMLTYLMMKAIGTPGRIVCELR